MRENQAPERRGRGRRPAVEVRSAVLGAAADQLFEGGLAEVTFEKVASRAGASKMTLYKWWATPGALALEAYSAAVQETLAFSDTGDLAQDLVLQLRAFVRLLTEERTGRVVAELIGAAQSDPDLSAELRRHYTRPRRQLAVDTLERARARGELRDEVDLEVVVDQLWGACYQRFLLPDQALTAGFADALVENLLRGIACPLPGRGGRC